MKIKYIGIKESVKLGDTVYIKDKEVEVEDGLAKAILNKKSVQFEEVKAVKAFKRKKYQGYKGSNN